MHVKRYGHSSIASFANEVTTPEEPGQHATSNTTGFTSSPMRKGDAATFPAHLASPLLFVDGTSRMGMHTRRSELSALSAVAGAEAATHNGRNQD